MFRRRSTTTATPAEPATAQITGKGRPTPKRREAEASRKAASKPALDRRAAYRRQRELARSNRVKAQEAMRSGAEALYPPRDRGPVRRFVRDYIDSRRSVAEFFLPLAFLILLGSLVPSTALQAITSTAFLAAMILVITDTTVLGLRLRRELRRRFPDDTGRGHLLYGLARSTQLRPFRLPKPRIKPGGSLG